MAQKWRIYEATSTEVEGLKMLQSAEKKSIQINNA